MTNIPFGFLSAGFYPQFKNNQAVFHKGKEFSPLYEDITQPEKEISDSFTFTGKENNEEMSKFFDLNEFDIDSTPNPFMDLSDF